MGDVSEETARRTTRELVEKGYLEQTGRTRSGRPILLLGRGPAHTDDCATHTDDRDIEEGGKNPGFQPGGSSNQAAASPAPPTGGSAATERKRKTGWRFVWSGAGGSHIRDPEGTDPPPKRGSPEELDDLEHWSREAETRRREAELLQQDPEPLSIRQTIAENVREHIRGIDVERLKRLADGECDDCERPGECVPRWRLGKVAVCRDHVLRRQFARLRVAEIADGFRVPDERDVLAPVEPQSEIRWVAA
jgi:hypothetical protein